MPLSSAALEKIIDEIRLRYDVNQRDGASMRAIVEQWTNEPKPTGWDLFNAAAQARKDLQNIAVIFTEEDIERWASSTSLSKRDLFNAIGASLAVSYHDHKTNFDFCDMVVNALVRHVYSGFVSGNEKWPDLFYNVYLAFDGGEYTRVGEEDKDPSEMYTRPAIATIISQDETKTVLEAFGVS